MANATDIIVTTGLIGGGLVVGLGLLFQVLKKKPSTPSTGGGRRTRRARRANNGTRRA
jgi:hypothetical protein